MHSRLLLRTIVRILAVASATTKLFHRTTKILSRDEISPGRSSSRMQRKIALSCMVLTMLVVIVTQSPMANAAPYTHQNYWNQLEQEDPEALDDMLVRLERTLMLENNKRGLDLGLSRGFSGSQAAKHLMGLAAANYAGGPGRRRRSEQA